MTLHSNTTLQGGKYRIIKVLGQGSFGITYLAEHTALARRVAIKEFFMKELNSRADDGSITGMSESSLSYNYSQKFRKEAQNLSRMDHPNIVRVTDSFEENGTFYYVMDYIEGENLNDYVKKHSLSEVQAISIIRDVAAALTYMHEEHHMLHLDLKPGNIMRRNRDGHIFLIDFGLSKHFSDNGVPETSTSIGLGTAGYAPLEQSNQSKNGEFRPTVDVYALGATLYKLLTGETPPSASDVMNDGLPMESMQAKGISANTMAIVETAMEFRARSRYQTIDEFVDALAKTDAETSANKKKKDIGEETIVSEGYHTRAATLAEETIVDSSRGNSFIETKKTLCFSVNGVDFKMIYVEGGTFNMGCDDGEADSDESPVHQVTLSSYYIGQTTVTQALWKAVMGNPSRFKFFYDTCDDDENCPVTGVSYDDSCRFIKNLNRLTGKNFRLPTEAEWEYAARGGNKSRGYVYSGSNTLADVGWYKYNSEKNIHPVATRLPNEIGIYDMSGNVYEWCYDLYDNDFYRRSPARNPRNTMSGSKNVVRGGCYFNIERLCRVTRRNVMIDSSETDFLGIRLALLES